MKPDDIDLKDEDERRALQYYAQQRHIRQRYQEVMKVLLAIDDPVEHAKRWLLLQEQRKTLESLFDSEVYPSYAPGTDEVFLHAWGGVKVSTYARVLRERELSGDSSTDD